MKKETLIMLGKCMLSNDKGEQIIINVGTTPMDVVL